MGVDAEALPEDELERPLVGKELGDARSKVGSLRDAVGDGKLRAAGGGKERAPRDAGALEAGEARLERLLLAMSTCARGYIASESRTPSIFVSAVASAGSYTQSAAMTRSHVSGRPLRRHESSVSSSQSRHAVPQ